MKEWSHQSDEHKKALRFSDVVPVKEKKIQCNVRLLVFILKNNSIRSVIKKEMPVYLSLNDFPPCPPFSIGAETLGPFGPHAVQFLEDLGNKISQINGERRSKSFLFQSIGIAIQRGNASCVMGTTGSMGKLEELNYL